MSISDVATPVLIGTRPPPARLPSLLSLLLRAPENPFEIIPLTALKKVLENGMPSIPRSAIDPRR